MIPTEFTLRVIIDASSIERILAALLSASSAAALSACAPVATPAPAAIVQPADAAPALRGTVADDVTPAADKRGRGRPRKAPETLPEVDCLPAQVSTPAGDFPAVLCPTPIAPELMPKAAPELTPKPGAVIEAPKVQASAPAMPADPFPAPIGQPAPWTRDTAREAAAKLTFADERRTALRGACLRVIRDPSRGTAGLKQLIVAAVQADPMASAYGFDDAALAAFNPTASPALLLTAVENYMRKNTPSDFAA